MTSSEKFTFDFFKKYLKPSEFLSFALLSCDESQSKAKFNLQSLGENRTESLGENMAGC